MPLALYDTQSSSQCPIHAAAAFRTSANSARALRPPGFAGNSTPQMPAAAAAAACQPLTLQLICHVLLLVVVDGCNQGHTASRHPAAARTRRDLEQERLVPYSSSSSSSRRSLGELVWLEGRERGEVPSCQAAAWTETTLGWATAGLHLLPKVG